MLNVKLRSLLACPLCHGSLDYDVPNQRLICSKDKIAYPIRENIPVLLYEEAVPLLELQ